MELFRDDGCLTNEGLQALTGGQLDELGRLEAAEHLSYCDKCTDRYTALLTADALSDPPPQMRRAVMSTIWVRLMQSTYGRAAVAGVAAVLALTLWGNGIMPFSTDYSGSLSSLLPDAQIAFLPDRPQKAPGWLDTPAVTRPGKTFYTRVSSTLESLLDAAKNMK